MSLRRLAAILAALVATSAQAAEPAGTRLAFVGCPIVRDTFVLCWMAEYRGELYFLGAQGGADQAFYPPQFNHQALVEGTVTDRPRIRGGVPLDKVKVATLPEVDRSCNVILPRENHPDPPHSRGVGPTPKQLPRRTVTPTVHQPPFETRGSVVNFDFDMQYPWISDTRFISQAVAYAKDSKARRIEVTGYRAYVDLSDGTRLKEGVDTPRVRADTIAQSIRDIGVDAEVTSRAIERPQGPDPDRRRAVIKVIP